MKRKMMSNMRKISSVNVLKASNAIVVTGEGKLIHYIDTNQYIITHVQIR